MSIYSTISKSYIEALKNKDVLAKNILSFLITSFKNKAIELRVPELLDSDCLTIIKKQVKLLDEEIVSFTKAGRDDKVNELKIQKELIEKYLPKQLSEAEIKSIIDQLEDKSMSYVMKYFKNNYDGFVDMRIVSKIVRG